MNYIGDNMTTNEYGFNFDKLGNVDTAYYILQGREARSKFTAEHIHATLRWFKNLASKRQQKSFNSTRSFGTVQV